MYGGLNATPPQVTPPDSLTATVLSASQVRLTWQDGSSDEWGFRVERRTIPDVAFTRIGSTAANVTSFDDTNPKSGVTYGYRVCAYQQGGNSAYSNEAMVTMAGVGAPTDLVATAVSRTQADLSWTDRASNETGFRIERRTDSLGPTASVPSTTRGPRTTRMKPRSRWGKSACRPI
ncbi:MAG: fibronectin type III domain-containing protein [Armatimonadetes bacterium]|nr:fibronectin type III domain-containing protein [Armatimonadota bacterium]